MSYQTDRQRAEGLGSAKDGTSEWMSQRLSAIMLIPLVVLFVLPLAYNLGGGFDDVREAYAHPVNAIIGILFFATMAYHLRHGLHEVIIDYIHGKKKLLLAIIANNMFCAIIGVTGIFSIAKIAFGG